MKKKPLKKISFNKLRISSLTISDNIVGGSGNVLCKPGGSEPLNHCPPPQTCLRTGCGSCLSDQANGC